MAGNLQIIAQTKNSQIGEVLVNGDLHLYLIQLWEYSLNWSSNISPIKDNFFPCCMNIITVLGCCWPCHVRVFQEKLPFWIVENKLTCEHMKNFEITDWWNLCEEICVEQLDFILMLLYFVWSVMTSCFSWERLDNFVSLRFQYQIHLWKLVALFLW